MIAKTDSERAFRAAKRMTAMLPTLEGFARALTQRPDAKVRMRRGTPCTDGTTIYLRPPIELGDDLSHVGGIGCGRRGDDLIYTCPRCAQGEFVLQTLLHEIAHIVYDSFESVRDSDKVELIARALNERPALAGTRLAKLQEQLNRRTASRFFGYMDAANLVSPYLPMLVNALEDSRVNRMMNRARAGTVPMFRAKAERVFREGIQQDDGSFQHWRDRGENSQILIGCLCKASGYDYAGWFSPSVEKALNDPELTRLIDRVGTARTASAIYRMAFPILETLRGLGFCKKPDDVEDDPKPKPTPEPEPVEDDEKPEPEECDTEGEPQAGESDDESENEENPDTEPPDEAESEHTDDERGDEEVDDTDTEPEDLDDDEDGLDGDEPDVDDDEPGEGAGSDEDDDDDDWDDEDDFDDDDSAGAGDDESDDEAGDAGDESEDAENDSDDDASGSGQQEDDDDDVDEDDDDGESVGAGDPGDDSDEPSAPSVPEDDDDPVDPEELARQEEDPDDAEDAVSEFGGHAGLGESDPDLEAAIDTAIDQAEAFDEAGNATGVNQYRYGNASEWALNNGWAYKTHGENGYEQYQVPTMVAANKIPEGLIAGTLLKTRAVFAENAKALISNGHRSGRVVPSLLPSVRMGNDKVFGRKTRPGKRSYFVAITLDISGSTGGTLGRTRTMRIAAIKEMGGALAELLSRVGVPFALYAHSASYGPEYDRCDVDVYVVKDEHESWGDPQREALAMLTPCGGNLDGHTLEFLRKRADRASATEKILLYVTDGAMPAENYADELHVLQREIKTCRRSGYTLLGVGVGTDSPTAHGLETVQVDHVNDIKLVVAAVEKKLGV